MTMSDMIGILVERIEDESDAKAAEEAYGEHLEDPETISHEDVMKEPGA